MKEFFKLKTLSIIFLFLVVSMLISVSIVFFTKDNYKIVRAGTGDNVSGFAWSENIGWISFNSFDCDTDEDGFYDGTPVGCPASGAVENYGVTIDQTTGNFSGYAWSENIGWISFVENDPPNFDFSANCIDSLSCDDASDNCTACYNSGDGGVYGWAKILSLGVDGWLKLSDDSVVSWSGDGVKISLNEFIGWAWNGSDTPDVGIGWVSFNCSNDSSCATVDYKVNFSGSGAVGVPAAPSNLTMNLIDCNSVRMNWVDNSDNEDNFETQWSLDGSSGWTTHNPDLDPNIEQRTISQSEKSTIYYQVRAKNSYGNSDWEPISGGAQASTNYCPPVLSASGDCELITLTWTYGGSSTYDLYRDDGSGMNLYDDDVSSKYPDTDVESDLTYTYRIRAVSDSLDSNDVTLTPCPTLPTWMEK